MNQSLIYYVHTVGLVGTVLEYCREAHKEKSCLSTLDLIYLCPNFVSVVLTRTVLDYRTWILIDFPTQTV